MATATFTCADHDSFNYIRSLNPYTPYALEFRVGEATGKNSYYERALARVDLSAIPAGATITAATLRSYVATCLDNPNLFTSRIYRVTRYDTRGQSLTWNVYKGVNKCWFYDGAAYTDNTTEANVPAGVAFTLLHDINDYSYFGHLYGNAAGDLFDSLDFDLSAMANPRKTLTWQYWDGAAWSTLTVVDGTNDFTQDGEVTWTVPGDWASCAVNGWTLHYVRVKHSSGTAYTTDPTCLCVSYAWTNAGGDYDAGTEWAAGIGPECGIGKFAD